MADVPWHLSGDYFENCSCSIVCPCLVSAAPPLTSRPTEGFCNVPLIFHIESGRYGDIVLDGLNVLVILHAPGVMADGDWSLAVYIDQRANDEQTEALAVVFQEVVHLVRAEEAEVAKLQSSTERPDEQPQECSPDAERSRGHGA